MKVLYVHGLESGPQGAKVQQLREAGFEVEAAQMPCNASHARKDPVTLALVAGAVLAVVAASVRFGAMGFLLAVVSLVLLQSSARRLLVRRMFKRSVEVQRQMLRQHPIDVVVGSSFGGAVALELINSGAWKGPAVLLCPAHRLVATRGWMDVPTLPRDRGQVVVVHGRRDEVVPLFHSKELVQGTAATLLEVDDQHRLSQTATAEAFKAWIAAACR